MPAQKRHKTNYPGVYFIIGKQTGIKKPENIFYIMYRRDGKQIHEKAGRQFQDDMTAAKAARIRALRITGDMSNQERREAEELQRLEEEQKRQREESRPTLSRLWSLYKEVHDIKGIRTDDNRFKNHIKPVFGDKEPKDLLPLDIDRMRVKLMKKRSPQTVKHILALLRRIINFGAEKGLCGPLRFKIKLPAVDNETTEDLNPDQVDKLLKVLNTWPDIQAAGIIKLAIFTGMRRSEIFRLKWPDIDFENGFISILGPKGGKGQKIPINSMAMDVLKNHPRTENNFIFPGRFGGQRKTIQKEANKIKAAANLPDNFRPMHGYRHLFASMLASSGKVDMFTLQKLLTHKSPAMTQRYAHLRDETLTAASGVVDEIFSGMKPDVLQIKKKGAK